MRRIIRKSSSFAAPIRARFPIVPLGDSVGRMLRSFTAHPLYGEPGPEGDLYRAHVAEEIARAYPGTGRDATGRATAAAAIRPEDVRPFDPRGSEDAASGMVHVQAYEQARDGKSVHVSDYERHRPGTASGTDAAGGRGEPPALRRLADSGAIMTDATPEKEKSLSDLHPHVTLEFDGHELRAIEDGQVVRRWPAVSGRPGFQGPEHQGEKDKGPIPEGDWILRQSERRDIKNLSTWERAKSALGGGKWKGLENSWGNTRVWLEPGEGTDTKGRGGFSVHGGAEPGSAGCIDLTSHMDDFAGYFSGLGKDIPIRVRYSE